MGITAIKNGAGLSAAYDFSHPEQTSHTQAKQNGAGDGKDDAVFVVIGHWIRQHHTVVEASSTLAVAVFTLALVISTVGLWWVTGRQAMQTADDTRIIERAYVTLSHRAPGLHFEPELVSFLNGLSVMNHGTTPARITDVLVTGRILGNAERLPDEPNYPRARLGAPIAGFLVAGSSFDHFPEPFGFSAADDTGIRDETRILYVIGYVDYIDCFGIRHRGGYARRFRPREMDNNLPFVTQVGYNYDRPRLPGEGNDWDEV